MKTFFSASQKGFYISALHKGNMPDDVVEISSEEHAELLLAQTQGKEIIADGNGRPVLRNPEPTPPTVPASITMRQCRLQLLATGKLNLVAAAIASLPSPQKEAAEIEWEYGAVVWRSSPLIAMLAPVLGWDTPEAVDAQFIAASQL